MSDTVFARLLLLMPIWMFILGLIAFVILYVLHLEKQRKEELKKQERRDRLHDILRNRFPSCPEKDMSEYYKIEKEIKYP